MFSLVSARYGRASLIVTSNKPFSAWGEIFGDEMTAVVMIDRLVHHAEILSLKGDSYRLRDKASAPDRAPNRPKSPDRSPTPRPPRAADALLTSPFSSETGRSRPHRPQSRRPNAAPARPPGSPPRRSGPVVDGAGWTSFQPAQVTPPGGAFSTGADGCVLDRP
jgi:IstB-like ATP binding protein